MQLTVQGKQIDLGDALRSYVEEKIEEINSKFFNHCTHATVTFSREGHGHGLIRVHITMRIGKNIMILADAVEGEAKLSFDTAMERVKKQLRRYKDRLRNHHERLEKFPGATTEARYYTISSAEEDDVPHGNDPVIVAEVAANIQTMSVSEAVMRMDLAGQTALLFRNAKHEGLNMIYRRPDGNVGWVDPVIKQAGANKTAKKTLVKPAKKSVKKASAASKPKKKTARKSGR